MSAYYEVSFLLRTPRLVSYHVYIWLCKHSYDITASLDARICSSRKLTSCFTIADVPTMKLFCKTFPTWLHKFPTTSLCHYCGGCKETFVSSLQMIFKVDYVQLLYKIDGLLLEILSPNWLVTMQNFNPAWNFKSSIGAEIFAWRDFFVNLDWHFNLAYLSKISTSAEIIHLINHLACSGRYMHNTLSPFGAKKVLKAMMRWLAVCH